MYYLLLLPSLIIGALGLFLRKRSHGLGNALVGLAVFGCIGAVVWQARQSLSNDDLKIPSSESMALNASMSTTMHQELKGKPGVVLLIFPSERVMDQETMEGLRNSFRGPFLRGHPELDVETARLKTVSKGDSNSAEDFKEAIAQTKQVVAIVSYAGVPSDIAKALGASGPIPVLVFDPLGTTQWLAPLKQGVVRAVCVPRPDISPEQRAELVGMPMENFGKLYYLATQATADQIAAKMTAK